jgi:hypothetical protein
VWNGQAQTAQARRTDANQERRDGFPAIGKIFYPLFNQIVSRQHYRDYIRYSRAR